MNPKDIDYFRARLLEQRDYIVGRSSGRLSPTGHRPADDMRDPADQAAEALETEIGDLLAEGEDNLLAKIDLALQRLDEGVYQDCASCGGRITVERLKAKPSASLCVDCQAKKEAGG
mgnify:CR=1 FL=1